jgi:hypothetical protein
MSRRDRDPGPSAAPILVVFPGDRGGRPSIGVAVALARERRARLALVSVADRFPLSWWWAVTAGCLASSLERDSIARADVRCRELVRAIAGDVPVEYRALSGPPHRVVSTLLADRQFGAVVVHGPWMRSARMWLAARAWRRSGVMVHIVGDTAEPVRPFAAAALEAGA